MLDRAFSSMRSMRAATRVNIASGRRSSVGSQRGGTGATRAGSMPAARSTPSASSINAAKQRRQSRCISSARSGRRDSAFTGLFRLSSSLPHCTGAKSACSARDRPARANSGSHGVSATSSCAASTPCVPRCRWPGASSATLKGTMAGTTRNCGATACARAALSTPFCNDSSGVPAGSTRASCGRGLGAGALDGEQHQARRSAVGRQFGRMQRIQRIQRIRRHVQRGAFDVAQRQAFGAQHLHHTRPTDEVHARAGRRQPATDPAADRAGTHDPHRFSVLFAHLHRSNPRLALARQATAAMLSIVMQRPAAP